jgi:hypothetical protein
MADAAAFGDAPFDEALLRELAALDAAEAGGLCAADDGCGTRTSGEHMGPVEDDDVYKMRELIK